MPQYSVEKTFHKVCWACDTSFTVVKHIGDGGAPSNYCQFCKDTYSPSMLAIKRKVNGERKGKPAPVTPKTTVLASNDKLITGPTSVGYSSLEVKKHVTLAVPKHLSQIIQVCDHFLRYAEAEIHIKIDGEVSHKINISVNAQGWTMKASVAE